MNRVILMGRLTRDPDVRYSTGAQSMAIARYTLAVDRRMRRDNNDPNAVTADFPSCVAFGRQAEFAEKYLHKGTKVVVSGRLQTGKYTNKDGQTVYTTDVVIDDQEFAESRAVSDRNAAQATYAGAPAPQTAAPMPAPQAAAPAPHAAAPAMPAPAGADDGFAQFPEGVDEKLPWE